MKIWVKKAPPPPLRNPGYAPVPYALLYKKQPTYKQQMHQGCFNFVSYNDCVKNSVRSQICLCTKQNVHVVFLRYEVPICGFI